ncbi:hypothetical protein NTG1052_460007 [Candidatus Nitrotoga sp. 1052]|nr:hypothetical protein NTG1052_460007 [Candidatus Nitrotoga sp. 1052]
MLQIHPSVPSLASPDARSQRPSEPEKLKIVRYNTFDDFNTITAAVCNPNATPEALRKQLTTCHYTLLPVYEGAIDNKRLDS